MIRDESDVRGWVKAVLGPRVFWIEPRSGGTVGFPDCVAVFGFDCSAFIELKAGEVNLKNDRWFWEVDIRPAQVAVLRRLLTSGAIAFLLVGKVGSDLVGFVRASEVVDGAKTTEWIPVPDNIEGVRMVAALLKEELRRER